MDEASRDLLYSGAMIFIPCGEQGNVIIISVDAVAYAVHLGAWFPGFSEYFFGGIPTSFAILLGVYPYHL